MPGSLLYIVTNLRYALWLLLILLFSVGVQLAIGLVFRLVQN